MPVATTRGSMLRVPKGLVLLAGVAFWRVHGDLPVHCLHHQVVGDWVFELGAPSSERSSCGHLKPDSEEHQPRPKIREIASKKHVRLSEPSTASTDQDEAGTW